MCLIWIFTCKVGSEMGGAVPNTADGAHPPKSERSPPTQLRTLSCVAEPNHGAKSDNGTNTAGRRLQGWSARAPTQLQHCGAQRRLGGGWWILVFLVWIWVGGKPTRL